MDDQDFPTLEVDNLITPSSLNNNNNEEMIPDDSDFMYYLLFHEDQSDDVNKDSVTLPASSESDLEWQHTYEKLFIENPCKDGSTSDSRRASLLGRSLPPAADLINAASIMET